MEPPTFYYKSIGQQKYLQGEEMKYYAIALKGWVEIRKSHSALRKVESSSTFLKDTKLLATQQAVDGFRTLRLDSLGRPIYKKGKQRIKLDVVDWEGGEKVAMLKQVEAARLLGSRMIYNMPPGSIYQLTPVNVKGLKVWLKL